MREGSWEHDALPDARAEGGREPRIGLPPARYRAGWLANFSDKWRSVAEASGAGAESVRPRARGPGGRDGPSRPLWRGSARPRGTARRPFRDAGTLPRRPLTTWE